MPKVSGKVKPAGKAKKVRSKAASKCRSKQLPRRPAMMVTLYAEHQHMATMLEQLETQLARIEQGSSADAHVVYEVMDYMVRYPDRFHHPREDVIFQRAAERSAHLADSVDTLQRDHDYLAEIGKNALTKVADWRSGECGDEAVVDAGRSYISELYRHMKLEERLVFPEIEATLSANDWRELAEDDLLKPAPDPVFGPRIDREFRNVARRARRAMRRTAEDAVITQWLGVETLLESLEVLSIAVDNSKASSREHVRAALDESRQIFSEGALQSPFRCTFSNVRHYLSWLRDLATISRDAVEDLGSVNRQMRADVRLLKGAD